MKQILSVSVLFLLGASFGHSGGASFSVQEGIAPRPQPGVPFIEPLSGAKILRVTSETDGTDCRHAYSYWPVFNQDSTQMLICCDDQPQLFTFDPESFSVRGKRPLFAVLPPSQGTPTWEDAIWSGQNPGIIFCHENLRLWQMNLADDSYYLLKDFSADLPPGYLAQMSRSLDDNTFAFTIQDTDWQPTGFLVWQRDSNRIVFRGDVSDEGLDEAQIDKSGRFLVVKTAVQGPGLIQARVVDLEKKIVHDLTDDAPDFAPGHSDNGHGTVVGADNWRNCLTYRQLAQPYEHRCIFNLEQDWSQDFHVSMLADNENWVLLSLYSNETNLAEGKWHDEILLVATDGSQTVRRLAPHRSQVRDYWDSPRAIISRDGRLVAFTSNWGGSNRRDVYLVQVPDHEESTP